ncbi:MAG: phage tail tape measure protein [Defluviitaleaceae bacterium]|nr:phage tail tape measure protein [Defluviitaleaceae bacterium]MCL2273442.1 phage tail tape measure protein [Defluviitaleaceae bacterium]
MSDAVRDLFMQIGFDGASAARGLADLDRKADDTKRSIAAIGQTAGQMGASFETQMSGLDKSFTLWERNSDSFTTSMERKQRRIDLVTNKTALLEREITSTQSALAEARQQFGENSEAARRLENQLMDLQIQQADLNREMKSLTTFDWSALDRIGDKFKNLGQTMTLGVTLPLAGIGALGVRNFVQLEDAWAGVEKVTSGTSEELENLRSQMHELVTTGGVPLSVTEMYGIAQAAGRLGIEMDNVKGFSETVAMLGTVTNMTAEQAATDLAQFATVMQMPQEMFDQLGATLVGLGNNMAATESDIMRMGARLTGAGNTIGLAEHEVLGFAAAFSALGINAEAGGTAFTNVMLTMQDSIFNMDDRLDTFASVAGKSVDEFASLFKDDAASAIVYFIEGLGGLTEAGYNTNEIFSELGFNGVNVTDLLRRGAGAGDTLRNALDLASVSWEENTALVEAAGKRYNTTAAQIQTFRNRLTLLGNQVGGELVGRFGGLLDVGFRMMDWLSQLNPETRSMIVTIGLVVAAIGPALLAIGHAIRMINKMRATLKTLKVGILLINKAMKANPIGLVIVAIGALIAIGVLLWRNWDTVREKAQGLWEGMKNIFGNIRDFVVGVVSTITDFLSERFPAAFGLITSHLGILKDTFMSIFEGVKQIFRGLIDFVAGIFTGDWGRAWQGVRDVFEGIFSTLGSILKAPINMIINLINSVISGINGINISVPNWVPGIGGRELGFNIPQIPMLAKGTDSHVGGPAIVGEKGPELVMLPKGTSVTPADETKKILNGLGMLKPAPTPDIGGIKSTLKGMHNVKGSSLTKPQPYKPGVLEKAFKTIGHRNRESKPDSYDFRKSNDTSGGTASKIPPSIENKVEVIIQNLTLGGDGGEILTTKKDELQKMFKEIFQDAWEEAWYALCLKYPNVTVA